MLNGVCRVAEHPLMLTALKAILKKKKVALPTIPSWHHQTVIGLIIWEHFNVYPFGQGDFWKAPLE